MSDTRLRRRWANTSGCTACSTCEDTGANEHEESCTSSQNGGNNHQNHAIEDVNIKFAVEVVMGTVLRASMWTSTTVQHHTDVVYITSIYTDIMTYMTPLSRPRAHLESNDTAANEQHGHQQQDRQ